MRLLLILLLFAGSEAWATGYALYNYSTQEYMDKKDTHISHSIASITKLFTAVTILNNNNINLDKRIAIECVSRGHVVKGTEMTTHDLLTALIVSSDNCAAETLSNNYPGGLDKFFYDRQQIIQSNGLKNTHLHDATGLSIFNTSTVEDLIAFTPIAYSQELLRNISNLSIATVTSYRNGNPTLIRIRNTNPAIFKHTEIAMSKTGFTNSAGRCVLMLIKHVDTFYAIVILGEPTLQLRTKEAERLIAKTLTISYNQFDKKYTSVYNK
jgi:D-alanyl-D-alanine endopeptidase (penicillin-binding protein 7)